MKILTKYIIIYNNRKSMKFKRLSLGTILPTLLLISCGNKQEQVVQLPEVSTMTVKTQNAELESVFPVEIYGQEDIEIRPRIDGFIKEINVTEGSVVRKGQSLFRIDSPQADQSLRTAEAAVASAEANCATAKLNVDRIQPLADQGIVSKVQYDTYKNTYESALASLNQAKAQRENAKATMSWTYVQSPVDGVVGSIPYRLGSLVSSSNILTTVSNTGKVYVYFSMNETESLNFLNMLPGKNQAEKLKNTPDVTLKLKDGSTYEEKGRIESLTGQMNISTGSAQFRATFPNPAGKLRSGTSGRISIPRKMDSVLVIPQQATFQQQDKVLTFKVQGDSLIQTHIEVLSTPDGKSFVVTEGLHAGDKIVTKGLTSLKNKQKVKAVDDK